MNEPGLENSQVRRVSCPVFISYASADRREALSVCKAIERREIRCWIAARDVEPGDNYQEAIVAAIRNAPSMVLVFSESANNSEEIKKELSLASRNRVPVIALRIQDVEPSDAFAYELSTRQWIDAFEGWDKSLNTLVARIQQIAAKGGEGAVQPQLEPAHRRQARAIGRSTRNLTFAAVAVVALIALAAAFYTPSPREQVSLAVLPFADLSPKHDKGYFAEGVAEEILSTLAAEKGLKVLGRTSARQVDPRSDPKELRDKLGVTHVVEGSARTAGDALRVNVRLVDTRDGSSLWEEEYRGKIADVFSVQDRIAEAVVGRLKSTLLYPAAVGVSAKTKVDAYVAYLAARSVMRNRSEPTLKKALLLARNVIRADPNYAPGQALYAELVWLLSDHAWSYGSIPVATARRISTAHARAAIRLAPEKADGYAALGLALPPKDAIEQLRRAVRLDPSRAEVRIWLALDLYELGRHDEALQLSREAAAIEPLWPMPLASVVQSLAASSHQGEANKIAQRYLGNGGSKAQFHRMMFLVADRGPDLSTAVREARAANSLDPSLPDIRNGLMTDLFTSGLGSTENERPSAAFRRFITPYYAGHTQELEKRIGQAGNRVWQAPDAKVAISYLASIRDWTTLATLYDQRQEAFGVNCVSDRSNYYSFLMALRAVGRRAEAEPLLRCVSKGLDLELGQKARNTWAFAGDLEVDLAMLSALRGNREQAFKWLKLGVDRGWLGRPISHSLRDLPAFDGLRGDPRFTELQSLIDRRISTERTEILAENQPRAFHQ
ncbi:MAG TPA: TIR domain-containing protein [Sphingomicrobium sp.]|nr:TIR domain-containing protein [Sphingomicrobium sp.]